MKLLLLVRKKFSSVQQNEIFLKKRVNPDFKFKILNLFVIRIHFQEKISIIIIHIIS